MSSKRANRLFWNLTSWALSWRPNSPWAAKSVAVAEPHGCRSPHHYLRLTPPRRSAQSRCSSREPGPHTGRRDPLATPQSRGAALQRWRAAAAVPRAQPGALHAVLEPPPRQWRRAGAAAPTARSAGRGGLPGRRVPIPCVRAVRLGTLQLGHQPEPADGARRRHAATHGAAARLVRTHRLTLLGRCARCRHACHRQRADALARCGRPTAAAGAHVRLRRCAQVLPRVARPSALLGRPLRPAPCALHRHTHAHAHTASN